VEISDIDTITNSLSVIMEEEFGTHIDDDFVFKPDNPRPYYRIGFVNYFRIDYLSANFNDYKNVFADYNITAMNRTDVIFNYELGGVYKNYYLGLNFGYLPSGEEDHDSLDIEFNHSQYGINLGYDLVDSKRILIQPRLSLAWNRYRLVNNDKKEQIPLQKYILERDLDVRFNQFTGSVGLNVAYKSYKNNLFPSDFWTIGFYGGYLYKINDIPWLYSRRNLLESNARIKMENYTIGMFVSFNIDDE
jgi:hypothetical protein